MSQSSSFISDESLLNNRHFVLKIGITSIQPDCENLNVYDNLVQNLCSPIKTVTASSSSNSDQSDSSLLSVPIQSPPNSFDLKRSLSPLLPAIRPEVNANDEASNSSNTLRLYLKVYFPSLLKPIITSWKAPTPGTLPTFSFNDETFNIYGATEGAELVFEVYHKTLDSNCDDPLVAKGFYCLNKADIFRSTPAKRRAQLFLTFACKSNPGSAMSPSDPQTLCYLDFTAEVIGLAQKPLITTQKKIRTYRFFEYVEAVRLILKNPSRGTNMIFTLLFFIFLLMFTSWFGPLRIFIAVSIFLALASLQFSYFKTKETHQKYIQDLNTLLAADESGETARNTSLFLNKILTAFWNTGPRHIFNTSVLPQLNNLIASQLCEKAPPGKEPSVFVVLRSFSNDPQFRPILSCFKIRTENPSLFDVDLIAHWVGGPHNSLDLDITVPLPYLGKKTFTLRVSHLIFRFDLRLTLSMNQIPFSSNIFSLQIQNSDSIRLPSAALLLGGAFYSIDIFLLPFRHFLRGFIQNLINKTFLHPNKFQFRLDGTPIVNEVASDSIDPITDLSVYFADIEDALRPNWFPVAGIENNLESKSISISKGQTYICYTRHKDKPPITAIAIVHQDESEVFKLPHPVGGIPWEIVTSLSNLPGNLNRGQIRTPYVTRQTKTFICVNRAPDAPPVRRIALVSNPKDVPPEWYVIWYTHGSHKQSAVLDSDANIYLTHLGGKPPVIHFQNAVTDVFFVEAKNTSWSKPDVSFVVNNMNKRVKFTAHDGTRYVLAFQRLKNTGVVPVTNITTSQVPLSSPWQEVNCNIDGTPVIIPAIKIWVERDPDQEALSNFTISTSPAQPNLITFLLEKQFSSDPHRENPDEFRQHIVDSSSPRIQESNWTAKPQAAFTTVVRLPGKILKIPFGLAKTLTSKRVRRIHPSDSPTLSNLFPIVDLKVWVGELSEWESSALYADGWELQENSWGQNTGNMNCNALSSRSKIKTSLAKSNLSSPFWLCIRREKNIELALTDIQIMFPVRKGKQTEILPPNFQQVEWVFQHPTDQFGPIADLRRDRRSSSVQNIIFSRDPTLGLPICEVALLFQGETPLQGMTIRDTSITREKRAIIGSSHSPAYLAFLRFDAAASDSNLPSVLVSSSAGFPDENSLKSS